MRQDELIPSPLNPGWLIPKGWENILGIHVGYHIGHSVLHLWRVQFNRHARQLAAETHLHSQHQLLYYQRGSGRLEISRRVYPISKGSVFFVPAGCRHTFRSDAKEGAICFAIDFTVDAAAYASIDLGGLPSESEMAILLSLLHAETAKPFQLGAYEQESLDSSIEEMIAENEQRETGYATMMQSHLLRLMALCLRATRRATGFGEHFRHTSWRYSLIAERVQTIIREQAFRAPELTLDEVARTCGTSHNHLNRILKKRSGKTFHSLLLRHRLEKARDVLLQGEKNCTEAAFESGFNDSNYFSRAFRKTFGYSPSEVMKK